MLGSVRVDGETELVSGCCLAAAFAPEHGPLIRWWFGCRRRRLFGIHPSSIRNLQAALTQSVYV